MQGFINKTLIFMVHRLLMKPSIIKINQLVTERQNIVGKNVDNQLTILKMYDKTASSRLY